MTAEPIRDPEHEPRAPAAAAPTAEPAGEPDSFAEEPKAAAPEESVAEGTETAAGAARVVDAGAADNAGAVEAALVEGAAAQGTAVGAVREDNTIEAEAVDAGAVESGGGAIDAVPEAPIAAAEAPAVPAKPSRRPVILAWVRRFVAFALAIALFVSGVVIGNTIFLRTHPAAPVSDGPITIAQTPPAVAMEFIAALGANNADAMRSSLNPQPNKDLTDEFARFGIKRVLSVQTLGTSVDGTRSATEILLKTEKTDGLPFEVNLVILVDGGQIEGFR
jgi:hypothetical protein